MTQVTTSFTRHSAANRIVAEVEAIQQLLRMTGNGRERRRMHALDRLDVVSDLARLLAGEHVTGLSLRKADER